MNKNEILQQMQDLLDLLADLCEDSEDFYDEDAIVLYAVPGKPITLVNEEYAIDELMINAGATAFAQAFISEDLLAVYPVKYAYESINTEGMVFVAGPMYICHPVIGDEDARMDLTAEDFCEILSFITDHTVLAKDKSEASGFLLEKED